MISHDLNWYRKMADTVASEILGAFGVELNHKDTTDIRDAIYRVACDAARRKAEQSAREARRNAQAA